MNLDQSKRRETRAEQSNAKELFKTTRPRQETQRSKSLIVLLACLHYSTTQEGASLTTELKKVTNTTKLPLLHCIWLVGKRNKLTRSSLSYLLQVALRVKCFRYRAISVSTSLISCGTTVVLPQSSPFVVLCAASRCIVDKQ